MLPVEEPKVRLQALTEHANSVQVDSNVNPRVYFRSGVQIDLTAGVYYDEGNLTSALILYMKYIVLFVERLPKHPQYKSSEVATFRKATREKLKNVVLPRAEELKAKLRQKYTDEYARWRAEEDERLRREAEERERLEEEERQAELVRQQRLAALEEERQLALEKKQFEIARQHSLEMERQRRAEVERLQALEIQRQEALQRQEQERQRQEEERRAALARATAQAAANPPSYSSVSVSPTSSLNPDLVQAYNAPSAPSMPTSSPSGTPTIDRSKKPKLSPGDAGADAPSTTAPNGFRWLRVPADIPHKFLQLATDNTRRNLEFCGILCGSLQRNVFNISHVIIPQQTATPDSCTMLNEEDLFDVQDRHSLITLGWIHTHPTQTSFLSSVDLHTQFSYQVMMDEAVAIVCAPRYDQTGLYSLTPKGMTDMRNCKQKGFHPHSKDPPLFEDCRHTLVQSDLSSTFIDLRS